jgi:hypothetical protein
MSTTQGRSKGMIAFGLMFWSSILGSMALGGCGSDTAFEPTAEAQTAVCASLPNNGCMNWTYDGSQWCTTSAKPANTACISAGIALIPGQCTAGGTCASATSWEYGSFRGLPDGNPNALSLGNFVAALPHGATFTAFSATRRDAFNSFVDALIATAEDALTDPYAAWCDVRDLATTAGYKVTRFFDSTTSRWLVYAYDDQGSGQSYFFYNPEPRRAIFLEAPHVGSPGSSNENDTAREGVFLFQNLAARGLVINGADRCRGSTSSPPTCGGTYTGDVCGASTANTAYHESDVAHAPTNAFHRLHAQLDADATNSFVQLHGRSISGKHVTAGDGRNDTPSGTNSMSNDFKTELEALDAVDAVNNFTTVSCQDGTATTYCGETNAQGRLTADGAANASKPGCFFAGVNGARFLHLEQGSGFLDPTKTAAQNSWTDVASALRPITNCIQALDCNTPLPAQDSTIGSFTLFCD